MTFSTWLGVQVDRSIKTHENKTNREWTLLMCLLKATTINNLKALQQIEWMFSWNFHDFMGF